jgi:signal peptidase I
MKTTSKNLLRKVGLGRAATFLLLTLVLAAVLYFHWASPPFRAVASRSMEPVFTLGDLILVEEVMPAEVKEGDIVVFEVPGAIRERYNYPPSIAHRVIKVDTSGGGLAFRTKGDNTGEDPFTVLPKDIKGKVRAIIPHVGYLILFFQSKQGLAFILAAGIIYLVYCFSGEIERRGRSLRRAVSSALASEFIVHTEELEQRQERTSQTVSSALEQFATAMAQYAKHLESHTDAVKGLAAGSRDLQAAVRDQNQVLERLKDALGGGRPRAEQPRPTGEVRFPPGCYRGK